jgi:hypothetical protein
MLRSRWRFRACWSSLSLHVAACRVQADRDVSLSDARTALSEAGRTTDQLRSELVRRLLCWCIFWCVVAANGGSCWVYQAAREVLLGDSRRTASQLQSSLVRHCPLLVAVTMLLLVMGTCVAHCRCMPLHHRVLRVSVCRSSWSPAVMRIAGRPAVLCSWCRACCVSVCFSDISVCDCVRCRIRRVCTRRTAVCLMLRRRRRRRLRCRSFDRSWCGGCCTVSVSAVLSVVLSLPWCPCLTGTVYGGAGSSCCSPRSRGRTLCYQRRVRRVRCLRCLRFLVRTRFCEFS